jgi:hypothetical protein
MACDNGKCEHCDHEFKPGEGFTIFDQALNKRINVECVENDSSEIVFKIMEPGHPLFGNIERIRKSWVN